MTSNIIEKPFLSATDQLVALNETAKKLTHGYSFPRETTLFLHIVKDKGGEHLVAEQYSRPLLLRNKEAEFEEGASRVKNLLKLAKEELTKQPEEAKLRSVAQFAHLFGSVTEGYASEYTKTHKGLHKHEAKDILLDKETKEWFENKYNEFRERDTEKTTTKHERKHKAPAHAEEKEPISLAAPAHLEALPEPAPVKELPMQPPKESKKEEPFFYNAPEVTLEELEEELALGEPQESSAPPEAGSKEVAEQLQVTHPLPPQEPFPKASVPETSAPATALDFSALLLAPGEKPPAVILPETASLVRDITSDIKEPVMRGFVRGYINERLPDGVVEADRVRQLCNRAKKLLVGLPEALLHRYGPILSSLGRFRPQGEELATIMENMVTAFRHLPRVDLEPFLGMLIIQTTQTIMNRPSGFVQDKKAACENLIKITKESPYWAKALPVIVEAMADKSFRPLLAKPASIEPIRHVTVEEANIRIVRRVKS